MTVSPSLPSPFWCGGADKRGSSAAEGVGLEVVGISDGEFVGLGVTGGLVLSVGEDVGAFVAGLVAVGIVVGFFVGLGTGATVLGSGVGDGTGACHVGGAVAAMAAGA